MNSSPDVSGPESPSRTDIGTRGSERFLGHIAILAGLAVLTQLPAIGPQPSLLDRIQHTPVPMTAAARIEDPNYLRYPVIVNTHNRQETPKPEPTLTDIIKDVVNDKRLNIPEKDKPFWNSRMRQIIKVESSDNPKAFSGKAYGFTQLRPTTAQEEADRYGIHEYDLFNGRDNIFLGLAHQLNLSKRYGTELGAWAHHLGSGNMDTALKTYFIEELKLRVKDVDQIFNNPKSNAEISEIIRIKNITPEDLLQSPAVTGKLKQIGAYEDSTDLYYSRLMAANLPQTKA